MLMVFILTLPVKAQDKIPATSGFDGFFLVGPGIFNVQSNLIATGPPLLQDGGHAQIESIFDAPESKSAIAFAAAGDISYTFAESRTQLYFGYRLDDVLRLDVPYGIGIRQELPDSSIMALSYLLTPMQLILWGDPYIEGEEREKSGLNFPGLRFRWGRILKTGLELTASMRWYSHYVENSGEWLIDQGRLDPDEQHLLYRDGSSLILQALYRIDLKQHRFEPAIRYINNDLDGAAMANTGFSTQLTYLYLSPKVVLDVNVLYGKRNAREIHPVYNEYLDADRFGVALTTIIPIKLGKSNKWNVWINADFWKENSKVDFFNSQAIALMGGLMWRYGRK